MGKSNELICWTAEQQKEHRRLWVEALRSGQYKRAIGSLRDKDRAYCCLGVACQISGLGRWYNTSTYRVSAADKSSTHLPEEVRKWLGLSSYHGGYMSSVFGLSSHNDMGMSFAGIADIIDSAPAGLIEGATR
jgi:hypothetical protein